MIFQINMLGFLLYNSSGNQFDCTLVSYPIYTGLSEIFTAIPSATFLNIRLSQRLSQVAYEQVIYLASSVESATTLWHLACQWISLDMTSFSLMLVYLRRKTHPPTDLQVVRFPVQSELVYPMMLMVIS